MNNYTQYTMQSIRLAAIAVVTLFLLTGCGSRQVHDSLAGSTAQRLVSFAIDDLARALPASDFNALTGKRIRLDSYYLGDETLRDYADRRLSMELESRFGIDVVPTALNADHVLTVFYTSLATDHSYKGFSLPLGILPGVDDTYQLNLLGLDQFHGIAELYYYVDQQRSEENMRARVRTDALGLPIITIPLSTLP